MDLAMLSEARGGMCRGAPADSGVCGLHVTGDSHDSSSRAGTERTFAHRHRTSSSASGSHWLVWRGCLRLNTALPELRFERPLGGAAHAAQRPICDIGTANSLPETGRWQPVFVSEQTGATRGATVAACPPQSPRQDPRAAVWCRRVGRLQEARCSRSSGIASFLYGSCQAGRLDGPCLFICMSLRVGRLPSFCIPKRRLGLALLE